VKHFYVPLGVENHLISWGVPERSISVLDWWEETKTMGIELICAPARHFSGRGLTDRASTLWCSWIIKGKNSKIYFSGDSGYGPHFKEIGTKYGPFDIALMECGQYNQQWEAIHMMPEQTAQAGIEVRADLIMPIHWGAFTLALHSWTDPVERLLEKAKELNIPVATPVVGEPIFVGDTSYPISAWWEEY
jgi:L-ascorbate metabolism protein UlaG (beta-lactamase superfamily)